MPSLRVVIQMINTVWTKASRGGEGARLRNALPVQLPLPLESFASPATLHRVAFCEYADFERRESVERAEAPASLNLRDLLLLPNDDVLAVKHIRDPANAAVVDRPFSELDAFTVAADEWGQLRYNGRYVDFDRGDWWYEQSVYNIGIFSNVAADRFVATKPDHRFVELATLR